MKIYCCNCGEDWEISKIVEIQKVLESKKDKPITKKWKFHNSKIIHCSQCTADKIQNLSAEKYRLTLAMSVCSDMFGNNLEKIAKQISNPEFRRIFGI